MTANTNPMMTATINNGHGRIAAANTARDGSGTLVTIFTAGVNGSVIWEIKAISAQAVAATSSPMAVRFFETDNNGANPRLLEEVALAAATPSTTAVGAKGSINFPGGHGLMSGQILKACQSVYLGVQDQMDIEVSGGDF